MLKETTILGKFKESIEKKDIISEVKMELNADELHKYWRRCSLTSDFFAKFYSFFFTEKTISAEVFNQNAANNSISFLLNELFENAAKYSKTDKKDVIFQIQYLKDFLVFEISNYLDRDNAENFVKLIEELLSDDPEKLYLQKLEENVEMDSGNSGLGYLTLMNDFGIKFGYKFETLKKDSSLCKVSIRAYLRYKEEK